MDWYQYIFVGLAAAAAGFVNALAGGGTLISFPVLIAVGIPAVAANITNTVALLPGLPGRDAGAVEGPARPERPRSGSSCPPAAVGGIVGGLLLLNTGEKLFRELIPYLILLASLLLAVSDPLRAWLLKRAGAGRSAAQHPRRWAVLPVALAAVYGGYFGAGLSVIVLAVLGLFLNDYLTRLNALKQAIAFSVNIAAAIFFLFSGQVVWPVALMMAVCALGGGTLGGRLAGKIKPSTLRWLVVSIGVIVAIIYFIK